MRLTSCPSPVQLAALFEGGFPDEELEVIEQHVAECSSCLEITKRLHVEKDTLAEQLRIETAVSTDVSHPEVERLIEQIKALRPSDMPARVEPAGSVEPADAYHFLAPAQTTGEMGRLGSYRVLKVLGRGGMGVVFLAEDVRLKRQVALKALLPSLAASPSACKRFLREAEAMAAVRHDHVVTLYQVDSDRGVPFLAMELLQGESLDQLLRNQKRLPLAEVLRISREVAEALAAAHAQGLIHRDVKPANIWLEGKDGRVKLLDFGLARALSDAHQLTHEGTIVGTPAYMAPEQAAGKPVDARSDLFSLGCVLYRMCTGELPFNGNDTLAILSALALATPKPPRAVNPEVPEQLSRLVLQLLAKPPEERPGSAQEVASLLASLSADPTLEVVRPRLTGAPRIKQARRRPAVALGLAIALICLGLVLSLLLPSRDRRPAAPTPENLVVPASAANVLDHKNVPLQLLARLGGGDPDQVAPELVVVLGDTAPFEPSNGSVGAFAWRPDSKVLVTATNDIKFWDVETGNLLDSFGGGDGIRGCEFSPDGKLLAIVRGGEIWDVAKRQVVQQYSAEGKKVHVLRFSPKGDRLAVTLEGGSIMLWDVIRGEKITSYNCYPNGHIYGHAFSPDGSKLATAPIGARPCVWDTETGTKLATCQVVGENAHNYTVSFGKDGKHVLSTCPLDTRAYVWDAATGVSEMQVEGLKQGLYGAVYSPDGTLIAMWGRLDEGVGVRLFDAQTGKPVADLRGPLNTVFCVSFSPDSKRLVASGDDKRAYVWDVATGKAVPQQHGHTGPVRAVAFSPDGQTLASAGDDSTIRLWDLATGKWQRTLSGYDGAVTGLAFRRGSKLLASGGADGTVRLWDLAAEKVQTLKGHQPGEVRVVFSPDGKTLASAGKESVKFWDLQSNTPRHDLPLPSRACGLACSADGKLVAVGCADGTLHLYSTGTGLELPTPKLTTGPAILDVAFHPREPLIAACSPQDNGIHFWDLEAEKEKTFAGFLDTARCCLWGEGGMVLVAAGGQNGHVRLWDLVPEKPHSKVLTLGKVEILGVALSPEGGYLATANGDGTVYILRLPKP